MTDKRETYHDESEEVFALLGDSVNKLNIPLVVDMFGEVARLEGSGDILRSVAHVVVHVLDDQLHRGVLDSRNGYFFSVGI